MTQRGAVFVGCRIIAIYLVLEGAATVVGSLMSMGYLYTMAAGSGRGGMAGMGGMPFWTMFQSMLFPAIARAGLAVFLWAGAGAISRAAAHAEEGDNH